MSEKTGHTVKILEIGNNKVTFTLINQFIEECYIYIKEPKSGLTIYSTFMTLKPGISYYIEIGGATSRWVKNAILEVEKDGILKQSIEFQFRDGKDRSIIVNSKKQNINCNKEDGAYNTVAEIFFNKTYERDYVKVEVGDLVVDVGANLGLFSLYAQSFHPQKIYAFEPIKSTYNYLTTNLKDYTNVTTINKAISDTNGETHINVESASGQSTLVNNQNITHSNPISIELIETITFNNFISKYNISYIDFLKVDCEGGELDLFLTIDKKFLKNNIKKIALEYHTSYIKDVVLSILKSNSFEIEEETGNEIGMIYAYNPKFYS